jgi:hypothetical protein
VRGFNLTFTGAYNNTTSGYIVHALEDAFPINATSSGGLDWFFKHPPTLPKGMSIKISLSMWKKLTSTALKANGLSTVRRPRSWWPARTMEGRESRRAHRRPLAACCLEPLAAPERCACPLCVAPAAALRAHRRRLEGPQEGQVTQGQGLHLGQGGRGQAPPPPRPPLGPQRPSTTARLRLFSLPLPVSLRTHPTPSDPRQVP